MLAGSPLLPVCVLPASALISEPHEKSAQEVSNESSKVLPGCYGRLVIVALAVAVPRQN